MSYPFNTMFYFIRSIIQYIIYIITHKYHVFVAGRILKVNVWRLLMHDISKFWPDEFFPYLRYFYYIYPETEPLFYKSAWWKHIRRNPHHWQHWLLIQDDMRVWAFDMPDQCLREMLADWYGAGKMETGENQVTKWWNNVKFKQIINAETLKRIEALLPTLETLP